MPTGQSDDNNNLECMITQSVIIVTIIINIISIKKLAINERWATTKRKEGERDDTHTLCRKWRAQHCNQEIC